MQAEVMKRKIFFQSPLRSCEFVARQEAMKRRRVVLPGCVGDKGEFTSHVSCTSSILSLAAETTLFKFVVLTGFNKTGTSSIV